MVMHPESSPPPYVGKPQGVPSAGSAPVPYPPPHPYNGSHATGPFSSLPHSPAGPTPIGYQSEGVGILPYYNPQAFHTQELYAEAGRRARWRFIGALMWAIFIWALIGALTGGIVVETTMR